MKRILIIILCATTSTLPISWGKKHTTDEWEKKYDLCRENLEYYKRQNNQLKNKVASLEREVSALKLESDMMAKEAYKAKKLRKPIKKSAEEESDEIARMLKEADMYNDED